MRAIDILFEKRPCLVLTETLRQAARPYFELHFVVKGYDPRHHSN